MEDRVAADAEPPKLTGTHAAVRVSMRTCVRPRPGYCRSFTNSSQPSIE